MTAATDLSPLNVADVITKLAAQFGINLSVEGIDDICYGMVIADDKTLNAFLQQHQLPYNYQILDGDPIRIVRRAINDSLVIDREISQAECIPSGGAAISFSRIGIQDLPRQVEIQYMDPDRGFNTTNRMARHPGAPTNNPENSIQIDFVITDVLAREMAFDTLYRIWANQLSVAYEHPNIAIETGEVHRVTCDDGVFTVLVQETQYTPKPSVIVKANVLLSAAGVTLPGGAGSPYVPADTVLDTSAWLVVV